MTFYLRFPDETTALNEFAAADFYFSGPNDEAPVLRAYTFDYALDVIGTITRPGAYDPDTNIELTPPEILPGWHANFIGTLPAGWEQYLVQPRNPVRVFAGTDDTVT